MASNAQKDKALEKHRANKSGLTKTDGGIDGLHQFAASFGAATSYVDEGGVRRQVTDQSLGRILAVRGVQVETPEQVRLSLCESCSGRWRELVDRVMGSRRAWDLTIQLYGLCSRRNWGIGDFRDLKDVIQWAGTELGANLLGVNPCITDRVRCQALAGVRSFCRFTLQWQPGSL